MIEMSSSCSFCRRTLSARSSCIADPHNGRVWCGDKCLSFWESAYKFCKGLVKAVERLEVA